MVYTIYFRFFLVVSVFLLIIGIFSGQAYAQSGIESRIETEVQSAQAGTPRATGTNPAPTAAETAAAQNTVLSSPTHTQDPTMSPVYTDKEANCPVDQIKWEYKINYNRPGAVIYKPGAGNTIWGEPNVTAHIDDTKAFQVTLQFAIAAGNNHSAVILKNCNQQIGSGTVKVWYQLDVDNTGILSHLYPLKVLDSKKGIYGTIITIAGPNKPYPKEAKAEVENNTYDDLEMGLRLYYEKKNYANLVDDDFIGYLYGGTQSKFDAVAMPEIKAEDGTSVDAGEGEKLDSSGNSPGITETLLGIIAKIIGYIIYIINSIIYFLFTLFVVPIISALLSVQPWRDNFVNIIYPGWLIIRNLANIAFIVSLLVVGLRVLFQVEDAAKSRTFIKDLIIMALLVNFSLVIAQGAVAIADTVQSQFLPKNSQVIEALGWKLMGEPAENFYRKSNTESIGVGAALANIYFPFILLILALGAFFSFIALAGFIFQRLVMLWLLYLVSPVAYFGAVLSSAVGGSVPGIANVSKKWWSEFIKYAMTVPILAFFLNMTALMATLFTKRENTSILVGGDSNKLFGGVQAVADFGVQAALTVVTHFIVLLFLVIGMKYAQMSGTFGGEKIVDFAKKGFDKTKNAMKKGAKSLGLGAKDMLGSKIAGKLDEKGKGGLANLTRGLFRPKMAMELGKEKASKMYKKAITEPAEIREMADRRALSKSFGLAEKANTAAWDKRGKDDEYADKDTNELMAEVGKAFDKQDDVGMATAARQMFRNGEHDDFVDKAKEIAIKKAKEANPNLTNAEIRDIEDKFSKDEDGLLNALNMMGAQTGMSDADITELKKIAATQAKKHDLDAYENVNLTETQRTNKKQERILEQAQKGIANAMESGKLKNLVTTENGKANGFTDEFIEQMSQMDLDLLENPENIAYLQRQPNYSAVKASWSGKGREQYAKKLLAQKVPQDQVAAKLAVMDKLTNYTPLPDQTVGDIAERATYERFSQRGGTDTVAQSQAKINQKKEEIKQRKEAEKAQQEKERQAAEDLSAEAAEAKAEAEKIREEESGTYKPGRGLRL